MAKLTIGQKAERVLKLLIALRNARIAAALAQHGFTDADLEEGWALLRNVTRTRLDIEPDSSPVDGDALAALDDWENKWFVISGATLQRRHPEIHAWIFRNLSQTEGMAVIVSVGTFIERWEQIDKPEKDGGFGQAGQDAKKILGQRGLTNEVIGEAKTLLEKLGKVGGPLPDLDKIAEEDAGFLKAEKALWSWYLEWSAIARRAVTQRSLLRQLGFLRTSASGKEEEVPEDELDAESDAAATPPAKTEKKKGG
ncbi:hypothetical protein [Polyangium aurulentum]|uniref:hypothetical protein n=1 Tax=Polyangium aurulentum TaxID=2567896 RepID=UPI0010ADB57B|nr:hypothetical protein [Polyangium aurulentum]UQA62865.1 hypothetical protein E8A73_021390 [Polyangium aurulentum]